MEQENKPKISINPPPSDKRCECCGKHISELKPYGKAGDPLVGDFEGALLIKTFRTMAPERIWDENPELKTIIDEMEKKQKETNEEYETIIPKLEMKYGQEKVNNAFFVEQLTSTVGASWECRDCIILDDEEYYDTIQKKKGD